MRKDIETKKLFGIRKSLSDGFTYVSGQFKQGRIKRTRNKIKTSRLIRNDKRSCKAKAVKRELSEQIISQR